MLVDGRYSISWRVGQCLETPAIYFPLFYRLGPGQTLVLMGQNFLNDGKKHAPARAALQLPVHVHHELLLQKGPCIKNCGPRASWTALAKWVNCNYKRDFLTTSGPHTTWTVLAKWVSCDYKSDFLTTSGPHTTWTVLAKWVSCDYKSDFLTTSGPQTTWTVLAKWVSCDYKRGLLTTSGPHAKLSVSYRSCKKETASHLSDHVLHELLQLHCNCKRDCLSASGPRATWTIAIIS